MKRSLTHLTLVLFLGVFNQACSLFSGASTPLQKEPITAPPQRVFQFNYDRVWKAAQKAMVRYSLAINNIDKGILETDMIKGEDTWMPPYVLKRPSSGLQYRVSLRVTKGKSENHPATRVTVIKKPELFRDFFSESEKIPSDGLEELVILYRIDRELLIEDALTKAQKGAPAEP